MYILPYFHYRHMLNREDVTGGMLMFYPSLYSYGLDGSMPAPLDTSSIQPERILVMDTFFHIVIYHGEVLFFYINHSINLQMLMFPSSIFRRSRSGEQPDSTIYPIMNTLRSSFRPLWMIPGTFCKPASRCLATSIRITAVLRPGFS